MNSPIAVKHLGNAQVASKATKNILQDSLLEVGEFLGNTPAPGRIRL
jgi:hypothetical protein